MILNGRHPIVENLLPERFGGAMFSEQVVQMMIAKVQVRQFQQRLLNFQAFDPRINQVIYPFGDFGTWELFVNLVGV